MVFPFFILPPCWEKSGMVSFLDHKKCHTWFVSLLKRSTGASDCTHLTPQHLKHKCNSNTKKIITQIIAEEIQYCEQQEIKSFQE
jgi:hypothetical protein